MTVDLEDFLSDYTRSLRAGVASIFVGAGMSVDSGLPKWNALLEPLTRRANVPPGVKDPTVAAEYIAAELGEQVLLDHILERILVPAKPTRSHELLVSLGARRLWTTNYDELLEAAFGDGCFTIVQDSEFGQLQNSALKPVLVKLHGSAGHTKKNKVPTWERDPIITRTHFETFANSRPLLWTDLTANFLTTSFLFLGFSFDDPNVEVLLRLSRSIPATIRRLNHYALMKRPDDPNEARLAELRWKDLERSGIKVVVVAEYDDIPVILAELQRRLRPPGLFVAGSGLSPEASNLLSLTGNFLATSETKWHLNSLTSPAAVDFGRGMSAGLAEYGAYDPLRLRFHLRGGPNPPRVTERLGTVIFHETDQKDVVRRRVLADSRVLLAAGGSDGTKREIELGIEADIPVVAIPMEGISRAFTLQQGRPQRYLSELFQVAELMNRSEPVEAAQILARIVARLLAL